MSISTSNVISEAPSRQVRRALRRRIMKDYRMITTSAATVSPYTRSRILSEMGFNHDTRRILASSYCPPALGEAAHDALEKAGQL